MTLYAVIDGGQLVGEREIANYAGLPDYKKAALDEKGDGGPTLRPIVVSGSGPIKTRCAGCTAGMAQAWLVPSTPSAIAGWPCFILVGTAISLPRKVGSM